MMTMHLRRKTWQTICLYLALALGAVVLIFPFLWMISTALREHTYIIENPPRLLPPEPTLINFQRAWETNNFQVFFGNSLVVAVTTTVLSVVFSAMAAYAFARFEFPGKETVFYAFLLTMMIPGLVMIIPQFLLAKALHLRNSLWGLILVYVSMSVPLNIFLLRGFFEGLPREIEDAVLIDGGGYLSIFLRIVLPLSKPALATVGIFTFLFSWDEYVWALTAIDDVSRRTLPVAIATFQGQHVTEWGLVFAASLIALTPVITVFVLLQRYFVKGLTAGGFR